MESYLQEQVARLMGVNAGDFESRREAAGVSIDSLTSRRLLRNIRSSLGIVLQQATLPSAFSISELANRLLGELDRNQILPLIRDTRLVDESVDVPLSYGQRALWFLQELNPDSVAHNLVYAVRIPTLIDVAALGRAFQRLTDRHPNLRATFVGHDAEIMMRIHDRRTVHFQVEEAWRWSKAYLDEKLNEEMFRPFDLRRGPLMRVTLYALSPANHIAVLATHHSISDMWSLAIVMSEVSQLYTGEVTGTPASLRPLKATYADHARGQGEMLQGLEGQRHWEFWREYLAGELPVLDLPVDKPRPVVQSDRGGGLFRRIDHTLTSKLRALAAERSTKLFHLMMAAYQVLLHRYSGQDDVLVGTPKASRKGSMARVIGFFVNPVVVRGDLSGDPTFAQFLDRFHPSVESAFAHDEMPFSMVVERLQPTRVLSHSPIFQVLFSWQKTTQIVDPQRMASFVLGEREGKRLSIEDLHMDPMPLPRRVVPFDLSLLVAESDGELAVTVEYNIDLFEEATADRILSHFLTLLRGIVADPDCRLSELPLQTESEIGRTLTEWNGTHAAESPAPCVHNQIEAQVARTPDSVALRCGDRSVTFRELNRNANRLAHYLRKNGVGPETIVGLCVDRSPEAIVGLLAILKAGGAYLPLDPGFPPERLAYLMEDARVTVVVTQEKHLERLPGENTPILCTDRDMLVITQESDQNPDVAVFRDNPAYVIYTSGSTGTPKGVPVSHGAIGDHCRDMALYYEYTATDRVLQFASLNFDASIEQILCPLLAGAQLVLRDDELWAPDEFPEKVVGYGLTVVNLPPAYWHQVAEAWAENSDHVGPQKLRLTIIGGDVLQPETLRLWSKAGLGHVRLLNAYGPTESTITSLTFEVPSTFQTNGTVTRIPIGRPLQRRRAYVLDGHDRILPVGVPGELCIGGKGLARGYLGRPDLTAERFVPDPHTDEPGQRMYKTGDVVRYLPDGVVEFFRRSDDQIKVRGFRVEPGEIETALGWHSGVRQVVVLNRQDLPGDNRLVAYIVPRDEHPPATSELRSFAKEKLPAFMVPSSFVVLESLPMTPGGKVDRQALPAPVLERVDLENSYVLPRTPVEQELADMWQQVLGVEKVGVHDNFFDLGGHSLLATQLVSRVRNAFHVEVPLKDLFDAPTVADIAVRIAQDLAGGEDGEEVAKMLGELEGLSDDEIQELLSIK